MNKVVVLISLALLLGIAGVGLGISNTIKLSDSEWTCIAQECSEFATGDDWVKDNCFLEGANMVCEFIYDGERFRVPLSGVNISDMVSCKTYECSSKVLISYDR